MFTAILWDYDGTLANTPVKNIAVTRAVLGRLDPALLDPLPEALSSLAAYQAANYRWRNWRELYQHALRVPADRLDEAGALWGPCQLADRTLPPLFGGLLGVLPRLAQYELTLLDWAEAHKGARQYVAFANKCWPAFQTEFKFVPCYVNSRLAAMGIPVSCEVDIYGALSEYIGVCVSGAPTTLLDINNTVPASIYDKAIGGRYDVRLPETFMGFHCGNTSCAMLKDPHMGYQLIMKRDLEPELPEPDITRGTMEGNIKPGDITFFRLQSTADTQLKAYVAQGQVLDVDCESFGSIGAFAIPEMDRFYRHVLIAKRYPHHGAVAFGHWGKALFEVFKYLGVTDIAYNQPRSLPYPGENPFV